MSHFYVLILILFPLLFNRTASQAEVSLCDISFEDASDQVPADVLDAVSHIIIRNEANNEFTYLMSSETVFHLPNHIRNYEKLQPTLLAPDGKYAINRYENSEGNVTLRLIELASNISITIPVSDLRASARELPYWLNSNLLVVPKLVEENVFGYDLVELPSGDQSKVIIDLSQENFNVREIPIISPSLTEAAYGYFDGFDYLAIFDITLQEEVYREPGNTINDITLQGWSPKGTYLSMAYNTDLNNSPQSLKILHHNGNIVAEYDISDPPDDTEDSYNLLKWSPTETYFIYRDAKIELLGVEGRSQVLVNVSDWSTKNICLSGEVIWSNDGKYIATFVFDKSRLTYPVDRVVSILVYDVSGEKLYEINYPDLSIIGNVLGWYADQNK